VGLVGAEATDPSPSLAAEDRLLVRAAQGSGVIVHREPALVVLGAGLVTPGVGEGLAGDALRRSAVAGGRRPAIEPERTGRVVGAGLGAELSPGHLQAFAPPALAVLGAGLAQADVAAGADAEWAAVAVLKAFHAGQGGKLAVLANRPGGAVAFAQAFHADPGGGVADPGRAVEVGGATRADPGVTEGSRRVAAVVLVAAGDALLLDAEGNPSVLAAIVVAVAGDTAPARHVANQRCALRVLGALASTRLDVASERQAARRVCGAGGADVLDAEGLARLGAMSVQGALDAGSLQRAREGAAPGRTLAVALAGPAGLEGADRPERLGAIRVLQALHAASRGDLTVQRRALGRIGPAGGAGVLDADGPGGVRRAVQATQALHAGTVRGAQKRRGALPGLAAATGPAGADRSQRVRARVSTVALDASPARGLADPARTVVPLGASGAEAPLADGLERVLAGVVEIALDAPSGRRLADPARALGVRGAGLAEAVQADGRLRIQAGMGEIALHASPARDVADAASTLEVRGARGAGAREADGLCRVAARSIEGALGATPACLIADPGSALGIGGALEAPSEKTGWSSRRAVRGREAFHAGVELEVAALASTIAVRLASHADPGRRPLGHETERARRAAVLVQGASGSAVPLSVAEGSGSEAAVGVREADDAAACGDAAVASGTIGVLVAARSALLLGGLAAQPQRAIGGPQAADAALSREIADSARLAGPGLRASRHAATFEADRARDGALRVRDAADAGVAVVARLPREAVLGSSAAGFAVVGGGGGQDPAIGPGQAIRVPHAGHALLGGEVAPSAFGAERTGHAAGPALVGEAVAPGRAVGVLETGHATLLRKEAPLPRRTAGICVAPGNAVALGVATTPHGAVTARGTLHARVGDKVADPAPGAVLISPAEGGVDEAAAAREVAALAVSASPVRGAPGGGNGRAKAVLAGGARRTLGVGDALGTRRLLKVVAWTGRHVARRAGREEQSEKPDEPEPQHEPSLNDSRAGHRGARLLAGPANKGPG
jgi:hypothetical protein